MLIFILAFILVFMFYIFFNNKLHIDFKSLFKKGFEKKDNKFGLYTYTGKQGDGKTYSAIKFITKMKKDFDYVVITNIHSYNTFKDTIYIDNIIELINFVKENHNKNGKKYIILFDEIFTVLMKGQSINKEILAFLAQLRKRGIIFVTTAQEWGEIPLTFRRFCRFQISCKMFAIPVINRAFLLNRINDGYNAKWDDEEQDFVAPLIQTNFSKGNQCVIKMYDTFETINTHHIK